MVLSWYHWQKLNIYLLSFSLFLALPSCSRNKSSQTVKSAPSQNISFLKSVPLYKDHGFLTIVRNDPYICVKVDGEYASNDKSPLEQSFRLSPGKHIVETYYYRSFDFSNGGYTRYVSNTLRKEVSIEKSFETSVYANKLMNKNKPVILHPYEGSIDMYTKGPFTPIPGIVRASFKKAAELKCNAIPIYLKRKGGNIVIALGPSGTGYRLHNRTECDGCDIPINCINWAENDMVINIGELPITPGGVTLTKGEYAVVRNGKFVKQAGKITAIVGALF